MAERWGFARTTAFRLTLLHLAATLVGTAILAGVAWWATVGYAAREAASEVERSMAVLVQAARITGPIGVARSIEVRLAADPQGIDYYLLAAPDGSALAGNLPGLPAELGWSRLVLGDGDTVVLALALRLPGDAVLVVGRDLRRVEELRGLVLQAAGWVGGTALLVGLLGGGLIGRGVAGRVAAMEAALAAVEGGDLGRRLGGRGTGDEFDRLAARIDRVLDRLVELMATVRQVTDDIAHDLRTPLSRLRQRLEEVDAAGSAEQRTDALARAQAECDGLLELFQALLRIAQIEAGERLPAERFDLSQLVETVAEVYQPAAEERGQTLVAAVTPGIAVAGDRTLINQLASNLVDNAIRHGRAGGRVRVALAATADGGAELAVADDGPGIPAAEHGRVFRRFHRLDAARATPGTGLGLALVKAIADRHHMTVSLEEGRPGLVVRVRVPPPLRPASPAR